MHFRQDDAVNPAAPCFPGVVDVSFTECDQFAEAIRHEGVEVVQTVGGRFSNRIQLIPLGETLVRYGFHEASWLCSGTALRQHVSVVLDTASRGPTLQNGQRIFEEQALGLHGSGAEHFSRSSPGEYFYAPIPEARFQEAMRAATGDDAGIAPGEFRRVRPQAAPWQALLGTIDGIRRQAEHTPMAWANPMWRAAMERSLLGAVVLAVVADRGTDRPKSTSASLGERSAILRRAQDHLREHAHQPVYLLDLCAVTGVSERTLRDAFVRHYGMGPIRYLKLRRLHQVRQTLRTAIPGTNSVKAVALSNGFWDFGRLAVDYRQLFGESPSATLQGCPRRVE